MARFDWYQGTIDAPAEEIGEGLRTSLPGAEAFRAGPGRQNYHHSMAVLNGDGETLATILHGGPNGNPNAYASGGNAEAFAATLRKLWPDQHKVTRLDSCEDLRGDYSAIRDRCRLLAAPAGVTGYEHAAHGEEKGSTDYLGASTSRVQHRCYEKGKQMAARVREADAVPLDWVRLEVQWRPDKGGRALAASVSPDDVWGVSPWVRSIAREVIGRCPDRLRAQPRLLTDFERTHAAFLLQYGPHLTRLHFKEGGAQGFLRRLLSDLGLEQDE